MWKSVYAATAGNAELFICLGDAIHDVEQRKWEAISSTQANNALETISLVSFRFPGTRGKPTNEGSSRLGACHEASLVGFMDSPWLRGGLDESRSLGGEFLHYDVPRD
jgi:hypothetical protein